MSAQQQGIQMAFTGAGDHHGPHVQVHGSPRPPRPSRARAWEPETTAALMCTRSSTTGLGSLLQEQCTEQKSEVWLTQPVARGPAHRTTLGNGALLHSAGPGGRAHKHAYPRGQGPGTGRAGSAACPPSAPRPRPSLLCAHLRGPQRPARQHSTQRQIPARLLPRGSRPPAQLRPGPTYPFCPSSRP